MNRRRSGRLRSAYWETRLWWATSPVTYAIWSIARRRAMTRVPRLGVMIADPVLGREVLLDMERFRALGPGTHAELISLVLGSGALLNQDDDDHATTRKLIGSLFTPAASETLVAATATAPLAAARRTLEAGEPVDLARLVRLISTQTTWAAVGATLADDDAYLASYETGERLVAMVSRAVRYGLDPRDLETARHLVEELLAPARAAYPQATGVMGRLRDAGYDFERAQALIGVLLIAGTETVGSGGPRIAALLLDQGIEGLTDPARREAALEEGLRLTAPSQFIIRSVATDTYLGGRPLRAGERLFVSTGAMGRWGELLPGDPGRLDPHRTIPRELRAIWFGAGLHFCIGAPIARAEIRALLELLAAVPGLRIVGRRPARGLFPAYRELWVRR